MHYDKLKEVLNLALEQAATGKGAARHANGRSFEDQPMQLITSMCGIGFPTGQAMKKIQEAVRMYEVHGHKQAAVNELLGAMCYCAGAIIHINGIESRPVPVKFAYETKTEEN